jgi:hypothetical protein
MKIILRKTKTWGLPFLLVLFLGLLPACEGIVGQLNFGHVSSRAKNGYVNVYNPFNQGIQVGFSCKNSSYSYYTVPSLQYYCYSCSEGKAALVVGNHRITANDNAIVTIAQNANGLYFTW